MGAHFSPLSGSEALIEAAAKSNEKKAIWARGTFREEVSSHSL